MPQPMQLLMVDTAQIQPYVFGSNRLRENVGASHLVAMATRDWAFDVVREIAANRHNVNDDNSLNPTRRINETSELDAEVWYAGGGNFVALLRVKEERNLAEEFTRKISLRALQYAPNLQLVIAYKSFDWDTDSLHEMMQNVASELKSQKRAPAYSAPLLGLSVTVMCRSTELPAVGLTRRIHVDESSVYPAAAEIHAKRAVAEKHNNQPSEADTRLKQNIDPSAGYEYPSDLDEMGRSRGESSFVAVVHADGDGMGQRIKEIGEQFKDQTQNRDYLDNLRSFSDCLNQAAQTALQNVVNRLGQRLAKDGKGQLIHDNAFGDTITEIKLKKLDEGEGFYLPFRPIVFGGDDVTFVCDGRLGLSLAIGYLQEFKNLTVDLPDGKGYVTSCAGVAIVKSHYPFARSYALAEDLCYSAKDIRRQIVKDKKANGETWKGSGIDWHFALSGLSGSVQEIREREYEAPTGKLTLRPILLDIVLGKEQHNWGVVKKGIDAFQETKSPPSPTQEQSNWSLRRNKLKALRDTLRVGPEAVRQFQTKFNQGKRLPDVAPDGASLTGDWRNTGWRTESGHCIYFDALELADIFIPLD